MMISSVVKLVTGKSSGFTLVELLVYISISSMLLGALASLAVGVIRSSESTEDGIEIEWQKNITVKKLDLYLSDIKEITRPSEGGVGTQLIAITSEGNEVRLGLMSDQLVLNIDNEVIFQTNNLINVSNFSVVHAQDKLIEISGSFKSVKENTAAQESLFNYSIKPRPLSQSKYD